ncbi:MAG: LysR family transcriptional regulator [Gammaproteobacteria bacterium HGW-Gammaproteobacteria-9]|jgi:DNA-binding transcriptional LysR family regulator|uniref:LysR family transcriptional regulator n=2 Tax=Pseudomonadaceae TaxID=135621 RepID=A0ABX9UXI7_9PSED|nr:MULTISPECIES: LysR substrate-binding domain-containing protein [Pseudomonadaceae]AWM61180.1 LysR family transcriptional regulator [Stutzerimonas stutzeri]OCX96249.1 MAG: LysR family transcriptional regulator [Pseudomonas sp. CO183]PKL99768.1 MAG: LysR family transcriptional regulator [Gammaproteobacteria bacterium HGW-Gammaproteobacteria-9]TDL94809.1 LysR family transcriptional regulator [Stutzerimonas stutzeri ATCC 17588 = LMG 11199]AGA86136.1 transcriptional regulator [Stutzerimonas stutz
MKDHQLKALIQVAESGSIRAAARAMNLSQSALTKALRELEEDVGAELLRRSYKGIGFTPAGDALLVRARLAQATLDKAREEIRQLRGGAGARIAIALTPLVAATILPPILTEFRRVQPDAALSLEEGLLTYVLPGLLEGRLDFAVALASPSDLPHEIVFEPLVQAHAVPTGRLGHPLAHARSWDELKDASWVLNLTDGSLGNHLLRWLASQGIEAPKNIVRCSSLTLMLELMRRTDYIGFGPTALLSDSLFAVGLQQFEVAPVPGPMTLGILSLRGVPLGSSAQVLARLFARRLRK